MSGEKNKCPKWLDFYGISVVKGTSIKDLATMYNACQHVF